MGIVSPIGDQGSVLPRIAALKAGYPEPVPGVQLNRFCGSGLEAVNQAAARVRSGWEHLILAGGVESMSRVPMASDGGAWAMDPATAFATDFVPQGISADLIATVEGYSREDVDRYAVQSQHRAAAAWSAGHFARSVVPVRDQSGIVVLDHDETVRGDASMESLSGLKPSFAAIGRWAASTTSRWRSTTGSTRSTTSTTRATPPASSTVPRSSSSAARRSAPRWG
jgi:acetyl-CoA C-acetyltransferase